MTDLKSIYLAVNEETGYENMLQTAEKWDKKYPNAMKSWERNWDVIQPIFKFLKEVRKVIYTTNTIESLNSTYKRLNRQRSVFPSAGALLKALYLATIEATKKWGAPTEKLGKSLRRILHHVSGSASRIAKKQNSARLTPRSPLDRICFHRYIYCCKGLKIQTKNITAILSQERYLQKLFHRL